MVYLKSTIAGIAGSILALILYSVVMYVITTRRFGHGGMLVIQVLHPLTIAVAALGFVLVFYLAYRR